MSWRTADPGCGRAELPSCRCGRPPAAPDDQDRQDARWSTSPPRSPSPPAHPGPHGHGPLPHRRVHRDAAVQHRRACGPPWCCPSTPSQLAEDPLADLSCNISSTISCATVGLTWQANLLGFPNAFLGLIAEPVVITIAVAALGGVRFPRWFMLSARRSCYSIGLAFAYWLFYQAYFVIGAMCPWCMLITITTTLVLRLDDAGQHPRGPPRRRRRSAGSSARCAWASTPPGS